MRHLTPKAVAAGKRMLAEKRVEVGIADVADILYAESRVSNDADWVRVCIAGSHTNVILIEKNGRTLFTADPASPPDTAGYSLDGASARAVYDFATTTPFADIAFILDAA